MPKKKTKPAQKKLEKPLNTNLPKEETVDDFDFGGIPKNVSLKRNIGCGG